MLPLTALLLYIGCLSAAPVLYDQRQEGEVNVHAQLEHVLVLWVPKSGDTVSAMPSLVNLFSRYHPEVTPPPEFESPEGNKTALVQAALEAAMQELEEVEHHTAKTEEPQPQTTTAEPPPTTDKPEKS